MAYKLALEKRCLSFLRDVPAKQFRQIALRIFDLLKDPEAPDTATLKGYPYRRADIGEYRVVYRAEEDTLRVILIGKRNDDEVYRKLKNL